MPVHVIVKVMSMNQYFPMISGLPDYYNDAFSRKKWSELIFFLRKRAKCSIKIRYGVKEKDKTLKRPRQGLQS